MEKDEESSIGINRTTDRKDEFPIRSSNGINKTTERKDRIPNRRCTVNE
jgi:hypothetical protein